MQCPNCGTDLKPGTKFCFNCGYYLDENDDDDFDSVKDTDKEINSDLEDDSDSSFGTNDTDFDSDDNSKNNKKKFDVKANLTYIILGGVLFFSLILLLYGVISKNNSKKDVTPDVPVQKTEKVVSVDNYKITVPAGLDYQIQNKSIFISDEETYSFSFALKNGSYDNYSDNLEAYADELTKLGYEVSNSEKKRINSSELLVYTLSGDSDVRYLYLNKYNSKLIAMGVINVHNSTKIDDVYKVVIKMTSSIVLNDESSLDEDDDDTDTENNISSSIVQGISGLIN